MMDVVSRHPRQGPPLVVLVNISGHGLLDLGPIAVSPTARSNR